MKYTIELTENQKKQMDFMLDMANKHMGFNRKLEMDIPRPMKESPAYKKGFEDGKKQAIHETKEAVLNNYEIVTDFDVYEKFEKPLVNAGWDVIVFIPSKEEDEDRITCGNSLLATGQLGEK